MRTILDIDDELDKISKEHHRLFGQEEKLNEEKRLLLLRYLYDTKFLNKYEWVVKKREGTGFYIKPVFTDYSRFDDLQQMLGTYPHGSFKLDEHVEIVGDDGDLYIISEDVMAGIDFIKSKGINITISQSIIDKIEKMEKEVAELKEFVRQFDIMER